MSTVNLTECLIVLRQRSPERFDTLHEKLTSSSIEFIPPDIEQSTLAASARLKFPLNLGDCFAYALAATLEIALLTLDRDFRATDIQILNPPVQS